jgi:hypothetical protein
MRFLVPHHEEAAGEEEKTCKTKKPQ